MIVFAWTSTLIDLSEMARMPMTTIKPTNSGIRNLDLLGRMNPGG